MRKLTQQQQVHFFCDNSDMPALPGQISKLLDTLGSLNLIPNTGNEINANTGQQNKFIIMVSATENFQVQFPNQEIVFLAQDIDHETFMVKVKQVLALLSKAFPDKVGNRLSVLSSCVYQSESAIYQTVHDTLFRDTENPFEWDYRQAFRMELPSTEKINKISSIRRCEVQMANRFVDSILYEVDCNTVFQNNNYRFKFDNALVVLDELSNETSTQMELLLEKR